MLPVANALSRAQERAADRYALETTRNPDAFVSAMKRLSQQNLAEERPSRLVRLLFYSHPPIRERIDAARPLHGRSAAMRCWRRRHFMRLASAVVLFMTVMSDRSVGAAPDASSVVAHRGASAYAPEHTLAAYRLAIEQGADFVEQDLAVTRDGVLICLHDASLERTTNVEQLFPNRSVEAEIEGRKRKAWLANDFTLAEIKQPRRRLVVRSEVRGRARAHLRRSGRPGEGQGRSLPRTEDAGDLRRPRRALRGAGRPRRSTSHGLRGPSADPKTPVILQTFGEDSARKLAGDEDWRAGGAADRQRRRLGRRAYRHLEGRGAGFRPGQGHRRSRTRSS